MSIIYSYPEQGALNADDLLIGTSATKVGGKQKNITRNFSIQQIADFINRGVGFVDPVATDFQIPVFNQQGKKITGSIMSQDTFPNGTGITITGSLTTTGNISTSGNLTAPGTVTLGSGGNLISLLSTTVLGGSIIDSNGITGNVNQILLSNGAGVVSWQNYEAGLTYEGTWDALNNTTNGLANSPALVQGAGVSGHFYIVNAEGTTSLGPGLDDWHIGDWAIFLDEGGQPASWQKIDNTSTLTGSGTAGTLSKWTTPTTLNDSLVSEAGTVVSVNGDLKVKDTIQATTTNTNLKLKGAGTGGVEIMSADGVTDGKITLNCSQNTHGVSIQSPAHAAGQSYTLILPTSFGGAGDVLTSPGTNPSQLVWTTPTTGTVTGAGTTGTIPIYTDGPNSVIGNSIMSYSGTVVSVNGDFSTQGLEVNKYLTDGAGSNGADGFVLTSATSGTDKVISWVDPTTIGDSYDLGSGASSASNSIELQLTSGSGTDNSAITLTGGTGITVAQTGDVVTLTGSAQGVTSVTSADNNTLTVASTTTTPVITAVTTGGVSSASTSLATGAQIQLAIDNALAGTLTFKGTFNATTGQITSGINNGSQLYTGTAGVIAITKGDFYIADTAGSFYNTTAMNVGDEAIALFTVAAAPPGSAITDWSVIPSQSAGGTVTGTGAATQVTFWDGTSNVNGDTAFNWDNTNKRLGIGTASPSAKLEVAGDISSVSNLENGTAQISILNSNLSTPATQFYVANNLSDVDLGNKRGALKLFTGVSERMRITGGGNVGIGTSSPSAKLNLKQAQQISGAFSNPFIKLSNSAQTNNTGQTSIALATSTADNYGYAVSAKRGSSGSDSDFIITLHDNSLTGVERMRITSTGQVKFNNYTAANSFTGTAVASLAVDSSGNIITEAAGGGGAGTITTDNFSGNGTVGPFTLGTTPSGGSTSFVDVFIDGVYQEITTYGVVGTALTFVTAVPSGVTIETKTTSGTVSGALVSSVDIGQSSGDTGAVNLRINPIEVTSGTTPTGVANSLYIFTSTTGSISTLTLPGSPTAGDSIKISNIGGLANAIATSGTDKIMGQTGPMTINVTNAAFELIWSNIAAQGWVIIGNV